MTILNKKQLYLIKGEVTDETSAINSNSKELLKEYSHKHLLFFIIYSHQ